MPCGIKPLRRPPWRKSRASTALPAGMARTVTASSTVRKQTVRGKRSCDKKEPLGAPSLFWAAIAPIACSAGQARRRFRSARRSLAAPASTVPLAASCSATRVARGRLLARRLLGRSRRPPPTRPLLLARARPLSSALPCRSASRRGRSYLLPGRPGYPPKTRWRSWR